MEAPAYQVNRNGQPVGTFGLSQLQTMYASGVLLPSDFVWTEGMKVWQLLNTFLPAINPPPFPGPAPYAPQAAPSAPNGCLAMVIPIGRSGWAILAGYLGLVSVLLLPAPFAIWCGILAIRDIKQNPTKLGLVRAWFGIIAGSFMMLCTIILILVS